MDKYNRNYLLRVQKADGDFLEVRRPFTIEFDVTRNSFSSANVASIRVYNLNPDNRTAIRKNQYDYDTYRAVEFYAGYGTQLAIGFKGSISQAWSVREGVNFISQIESFDGGFAYINSITEESFPQNTPQSAIIDSVIGDLEHVTQGAVGDFPGQISRGAVVSGSSTDALASITGGAFFIDNGKANCLKDNECIATLDIPIINAKSGLLGTPVREDRVITLEMLFEPNIQMAQLVELQSLSAEHLNGIHKVISIKHRGVISEAVSGDAVTSLKLLPGTFLEVSERQ